MACDPGALTPEDGELLDRVATRIVELRLETPALLTLEGGRPLSLLAGQTLVFFEPIIGGLLRLPDYRRFAALVERRETLEVLIQKIERRADAAHAARRAAASERKASRAAGRPGT